MVNLPLIKLGISKHNGVLETNSFYLLIDSYMSQLEGKMSLFLAITTIIPITVSMLLVIMGYINVSMLVFLPLVFLVFDLIAVEIFNSGKVELLGG